MTKRTEEKERDRAYGATVINYVNAKNINEAYLNLVDDVQKAFEFSPDFAEKGRKTANKFFKLGEDLLGHEGLWHNAKTLIDSLVNGKGLSWKFRKYFMDIYNNLNLPTYHMDSDGSIDERAPLSERAFRLAFGKFGNMLVKDPEAAFVGMLSRSFVYCLFQFLKSDRNRESLSKCDACHNYYCKTKLVKDPKKAQRFCSDKCRLTFHNRVRIKSGKAAVYKRKKRQEGAKKAITGKRKR